MGREEGAEELLELEFDVFRNSRDIKAIVVGEVEDILRGKCEGLWI